MRRAHESFAGMVRDQESKLPTMFSISYTIDRLDIIILTRDGFYEAICYALSQLFKVKVASEEAEEDALVNVGISGGVLVFGLSCRGNVEPARRG